VAGGTAANGQGIAGVGWNVPLVGIRPLRPRDDGQTRTVAAAQTLARKSASVAVYDDTLIDQFAVANALKVPVVNMGFGAQLFARRNVIAARNQHRARGASGAHCGSCRQQHSRRRLSGAREIRHRHRWS